MFFIKNRDKHKKEVVQNKLSMSYFVTAFLVLSVGVKRESGMKMDAHLHEFL